MIKTAGLDLDEVILNFNQIAIERFNEKYDADFSKSSIHDFDWYRNLYNLSADQFYRDIIELRLFEDARPLEGSIEAVDLLKSKGAHVSIVTSRGFHPEARAITTKWLERNKVKFDRLEIVGHNKSKSCYFRYPVDIFVDDHIKNHEDMIKSGLSRKNIVIANKWNDVNIHCSEEMSSLLSYRDTLYETVISEVC